MIRDVNHFANLWSHLTDRGLNTESQGGLRCRATLTPTTHLDVHVSVFHFDQTRVPAMAGQGRVDMRLEKTLYRWGNILLGSLLDHVQGSLGNWRLISTQHFPNRRNDLRGQLATKAGEVAARR